MREQLSEMAPIKSVGDQVNVGRSRVIVYYSQQRAEGDGPYAGRAAGYRVGAVSAPWSASAGSISARAIVQFCGFGARLGLFDFSVRQRHLGHIYDHAPTGAKWMTIFMPIILLDTSGRRRTGSEPIQTRTYCVSMIFG